MKKGEVWISVVLYMALGVIAVTLILTAGIPLINQMRDRNTIVQTKNIFHVLDENIRAVANEGPGSKRYLSPFEIKAGEFYVDAEDSDIIEWSIKTSSRLMEPDIEFKEGSIIQVLEETIIVDEYIMKLKLDYSEIYSINLNSEFAPPFTGVYSLSIENRGYDEDLPEITLRII